MNSLLQNLLEKEIISKEKADQIAEYEADKPLSIFWELRTLLYLGISCLSGGLGILIYQNIDTIGHGVIIGLMALACLFCFWYAFKHRQAFTWDELKNIPTFSDFALLGGCVLFLSLEAYLQYQYQIFGDRYGLASLIPAILFVALAYYFDHRGVLSMGITAAASFVGISIAPKDIFTSLDLTQPKMIYTGIAFGLFLVLIGGFSEYKNKKKHFSFAYYFFGGNLAFVAVLTALISLDFKFLFLALLLIMSALSIIHARQTHSYMMLLMGVLYGYIGITYFIFSKIDIDVWLFLSFFYFVASCGGLIYFLFNVKKILGIEKQAKI